MQHRSVVATGVVFILVMVLHALTVSTAHGETISIAQARQQTLGTVVNVQGWVTVPPCKFQSFSFDCGFAIQDNSAGIYVSVPAPLPPSFPPLVLFQKVQVTGALEDSFGLLILSTDPANVTAISTFKVIAPQESTTCGIDEDTEGRLVHVVGRVTQPSELDKHAGHTFGYRVFIKSDPPDGNCELQVFISVDAGNPLVPPWSNIIVVNQLIEVTGFSGQFDDHYEVNPRFLGDIQQAP